MYKDKILNLLRASQSGFVSGEELARKTGISRTMVWKHMKALERDGFGIEAVPSQGYRITLEPDLLLLADIKRELKTRVIGRTVLLFPEVASTNTLAMELAAKGTAEGTVVIAETQTGGKGRLGRKWLSPKGNLYFSVVLRPAVPLQKAPLITLMGATAVAAAVKNVCAVPAGIKWPNDVLVAGRKVSGLLTEMSAEQDRIRHIVLGIGINVNMDTSGLPPDLRAGTTTLAAEAGRRINRTALLQEVLRGLELRYRSFLTKPAEVIEAWKRENVTLGKQVAVAGAGATIEGTAQGIDEEGRLVIEQADGLLHSVAAGDVTILKGR